jgi:hypothetical protein
MRASFNILKISTFVYETIFLVVLFFVYTYDRHNHGIEYYDFVFFSFYVIVAFFISKKVMPRYFYSKQYFLFWTLIVSILLAVYAVEEYVLEPIFVGGERADHVSNIFYTLIGIAPIIFMVVSFKIVWQMVRKQQELEQLQLSVKESELRFLKSQINPHFLFNNLNNLYAYAIENSSKTPSIILELSSVLRYMIYDCKADKVVLSKDIEHLQNFVKLNELQIEDRGAISFTTIGSHDNFKIAPLILVTFVENAFKHSLASQSENIVIDIAIHVSDKGQLSFTCANSFLPNSNNDSLDKGIGLDNVKKRLQLLYPNKHKLKLKEAKRQFIVELTLDLI